MTPTEEQIVLGQIRKHEGMVLKPYKDPEGHWTIGIGRLLSRGISAQEAIILAANDIRAADKELTMNFRWYTDLSGDRKYAWVNLAFNLGVPRLKTFKRAIAAMERCDYDAAAKEILNSKYARQVGQRAIDIADMIR